MDKKMLVEDSMRCPISGLTMKDPVLASDGHSYDRASMTKWLATKSTSPVTGEKLDKSILVPNHQLRSEMESWNEYKEGEQPASSHLGDVESVIPAVSSRPTSAAISSVVMEARTVSPHKAMQRQDLERVSTRCVLRCAQKRAMGCWLSAVHACSCSSCIKNIMVTVGSY